MSNALHVWHPRTDTYHCLMCEGVSEYSPFRPDDHAAWCHTVRWFLWLDTAGVVECCVWGMEDS